MSAVKVRADNFGNVIHVSENNPEYGWVLLAQPVVTMERGWFRKKERIARIMGLVKDLQAQGFYKDQVLPGKIVVKESLTPFNDKDPDRNLKMSGRYGIPCTYYGEPIYRECFYTENKEDHDVLISHTNTREIKEVREAEKALIQLQVQPEL